RRSAATCATWRGSPPTLRAAAPAIPDRGREPDPASRLLPCARPGRWSSVQEPACGRKIADRKGTTRWGRLAGDARMPGGGLRTVGAEDVVLAGLGLVAGEAGRGGLVADHALGAAVAREALEAPAARGRVALRFPVHDAHDLAGPLGDRVAVGRRLEQVE